LKIERRDRPLKIKEERKSNGMQKISLVHELNAPLGREGSRLVLWLSSIDFGRFLREHTRHKSHYLSARAKRRGHARLKVWRRWERSGCGVGRGGDVVDQARCSFAADVCRAIIDDVQCWI
jgi:hypothetical protein